MKFIERKIQELADLSGKFAAEFSDLSAADADLKPEEKAWSINECLDHIIQCNRSYHNVLDAVAQNRHRRNAWSRIPFLPTFWAKMILKAVSPETQGKSKTFPVFMPLSSRYGRNLAGEVATSNAQLTEKLKAIREEDLDKQIITSPAGPFVTYSLRACITILVEHEKRHFNQAKRLKDALAGQKVPAGSPGAT
ncbi:MAG: DinB family protein [Fibrobacteres bacterium]|jgi:hypothetical protein|nr:DinB family protein [Fibrobacterota bacterium]